MIGKKFGKLTVLELVRKKYSNTKAICICDCGTEHTCRMASLNSGNTTSCGCKRYDDNIFDLKGGRKIFSTWDNIKGRCHRPNSNNYKWYGAKGITLCAEWLTDFRAFYKWSIENGWKEGLVLDKDELCDTLGISPKIYSPETCQWVTQQYNLSLKTGEVYAT